MVFIRLENVTVCALTHKAEVSEDERQDLLSEQVVVLILT
jgi:hypothetical protein